ncbi:ABC transporter substrate-binding protein [Nocardiopsis sp. MG754419]|uniref:ABC transporter substrate-binding protein n=1 Tax=Nocardiopsis sp. MG754419 TaxID=2259865 RepID=UPI001BADFD91|nr:extracellular solute-binding protein [Nocardiopsis sp. MG754419]MBR8743233.1 ABC transporter substrate-binding protein [Nocardiopsis sp. MG754419]
MPGRYTRFTAPEPARRHALRAFTRVGAGATAVLVLTSCATLSTGDGPDNVPEDVSTSITDEPVELTLAYTDDPPSTELVEGFTEQYPNVTVELQQTPFTDYVKTVTLAMSSDEPPDIAQYNPGAMRSLIPGRHVLDLEPYVEAYGWEETFPEASLEPLRADEDATRFGTGSLYAVPGALSMLGVFYNRELLEEAGVTRPPGTFAEFEEALDAVDAEGTTAFSVGGLEVGGFQVWNTLLNTFGDDREYRDWVHGAPEASIETDAALEATETLTRWVEAGYVPEGANATSDDDAKAAFTGGESAFLVIGNWAAFELEEAMGEDVGFFLMPGEDPDAAPVTSGSSVSYTVSSATEHPDVAAAFLDYLASPEAALIQSETGFMPVDTDVSLEQDGVWAEINDVYGTAAEQDGIVPFPDFATPGMIDQLTPGVQGLIAGSTEETTFLSDLQSEWERHHG